LTDELTEGSRGVTEALGDILLAAVIDEDGAQSLVLTLERAGGLEEEEATRSIVHGGGLQCEVILRRRWLWSVPKGRGTVYGPHAAKGRRVQENQGRRGCAGR
jgi:hypothetical protein